MWQTIGPKLLLLLCVLTLAAEATHAAAATAQAAPSVQTKSGDRGWGRHRHRGGKRAPNDAYRRHGRSRHRDSIGAAYRRAGVSAGRGVGGFGKHTGIGTARLGKKVGRGVKRIFTR